MTKIVGFYSILGYKPFMLKSAAKLLCVALLVSSSFSRADDIVYESSSGIFGRKTTVHGPSSSTIFFSQNGSGTLFATGQAAAKLGGGESRQSEQNVPKKTRLVPISVPGMSAIAPLTELGEKVFIASRHALLGIPRQSLENALRAAGLSLEKARFYEFVDSNGKSLDAVVISAGRFSLGWLDSDPQINVGDDYFSYQLGTVGNQPVEQQSAGRIEQAGENRFYLPLNSADLSTARSSGSVVYVFEDGSSWSLGGVIECYVPPRVSAQGVAIPGGVRAIPFSELKRASQREIAPESLIDSSAGPSPVGQDGQCIPIDGRGGGGA